MKRLALVLSACLLSCASLPAHVKERPLFTTFNPAGEYGVAESTVPFSPANPVSIKVVARAQTYGVKRAFTVGQENRWPEGPALVDGDMFYVVWPLTKDVLAAEKVRLTLGDKTAGGFGTLLANRGLTWEEFTPKNGGEPFATGGYFVKGVNAEPAAYKAEAFLNRKADDSVTIDFTFKDEVSTIAVAGTMVDGRFLGARYPLSWKSEMTTSIQGGVRTVEVREGDYRFAGFLLGAYHRDGDALKGTVTLIPFDGSKAQRFTETLRRSGAPAP